MNLAVKWPRRGRYVLAVSGGVDSMALLDMFAAAADERDYELIVAHFDHGMRPTSARDRHLVEREAARRHLAFEYAAGELGQASEAIARLSRYAWLREIARRHDAQFITAHHQDDLIETSLLNLARGTVRRGLVPMRSNGIIRPLLEVPKAQLLDYAQSRTLVWHEDETNTDVTNPRNFVRSVLLPHAETAWRSSYLNLIGQLADLDHQIQSALADLLAEAKDGTSYRIRRHLIADLSLAEIAELIAAAARSLEPSVELENRRVAELALFAKTAAPHRRRPVNARLEVRVKRDYVIIALHDH